MLLLVPRGMSAVVDRECWSPQFLPLIWYNGPTTNYALVIRSTPKNIRALLTSRALAFAPAFAPPLKKTKQDV